MQTAEFDYHLPAALIAQEPLAQRDASRLLYVDAASGAISHRTFADLAAVLREKFPQDSGKILLLANDSRVYPARLRIRRASGARGEVFLLDPHAPADSDVRCLLRPLKKLNLNETLLHDAPGLPHDGTFAVEVASLEPALVRCATGVPAADLFRDFGEMPLPPYIARDPKRGLARAALDRVRYQTVYAQGEGSAAAPTAGLHFTPETFSACAAAGIEFAALTLHVGLGTFQPVTAAELDGHEMHTEMFSVSSAVAVQISTQLEKGWPIVCVGTTALRALESFSRLAVGVPACAKPLPSPARDAFTAAKANGSLAQRFAALADAWHPTSLFIRPAHRSDVIRPLCARGLITNFHQPCSTLVMLVAALLGYDAWRTAYAEAVAHGYRFLSYGDSSLLTWEDPA